MIKSFVRWERDRRGCTVSRLAEWNLQDVSGATPDTAGGTPALPFGNQQHGVSWHFIFSRHKCIRSNHQSCVKLIENPNGIPSSSPALTRSGYAGFRPPKQNQHQRGCIPARGWIQPFQGCRHLVSSPGVARFHRPTPGWMIQSLRDWKNYIPTTGPCRRPPDKIRQQLQGVGTRPPCAMPNC